jgi:hypothetical protein
VGRILKGGPRGRWQWPTGEGNPDMPLGRMPWCRPGVVWAGTAWAEATSLALAECSSCGGGHRRCAPARGRRSGAGKWLQSGEVGGAAHPEAPAGWCGSGTSGREPGSARWNERRRRRRRGGAAVGSAPAISSVGATTCARGEPEEGSMPVLA